MAKADAPRQSIGLKISGRKSNTPAPLQANTAGIQTENQHAAAVVHSAIMQAGCTLQDLCPEDKQKVAGLLKQIVELGQDKQRFSNEVEQMRDALQEQGQEHEQQLSKIKDTNLQLALENANLKAKLAQMLTVLRAYQQRLHLQEAALKKLHQEQQLTACAKPQVMQEDVVLDDQHQSDQQQPCTAAAAVASTLQAMQALRELQSPAQESALATASQAAVNTQGVSEAVQLAARTSSERGAAAPMGPCISLPLGSHVSITIQHQHQGVGTGLHAEPQRCSDLSSSSQGNAQAMLATSAGCYAAPDTCDAASSPMCRTKTGLQDSGTSQGAGEVGSSRRNMPAPPSASPATHSASQQHSSVCSPSSTASVMHVGHAVPEAAPEACTPVSRGGSRSTSMGGRVVVVDACTVSAAADDGLIVQDVQPAAEEGVMASPVLVAPELAGDAARSLLAWQLQQGLMTPNTAEDVAAHGGGRVLRYDPTIGRQGAFYFQEVATSISDRAYISDSHNSTPLAAPQLLPLPGPSGAQGDQPDHTAAQMPAERTGSAHDAPQDMLPATAVPEKAGAEESGELTEAWSDLESELTLGSLGDTPGRTPLRWRVPAAMLPSIIRAGAGAGVHARSTALQGGHQAATEVATRHTQIGAAVTANVDPSGSGLDGAQAQGLGLGGAATKPLQPQPAAEVTTQSIVSPARRAPGTASAAAWAAAAAARALLQQSPVLARAASRQVAPAAGVQCEVQPCSPPAVPPAPAPAAPASAPPNASPSGRALKPCDLHELLQGTGCAKRQPEAQPQQPTQLTQPLQLQSRYQSQQQAEEVRAVREHQMAMLLKPLNVMPASSNDSTAVTGLASLGHGVAPGGAGQAGLGVSTRVELADDASSGQLRQGSHTVATQPNAYPQYGGPLYARASDTWGAAHDRRREAGMVPQLVAAERATDEHVLRIPTQAHHNPPPAQFMGDSSHELSAAGAGRSSVAQVDTQQVPVAGLPAQQALRGQLSSTLLSGSGTEQVRRRPFDARGTSLGSVSDGRAASMVHEYHDFDESLMDLLAEVESMHDDPDAAAYRPHHHRSHSRAQQPAASAAQQPPLTHAHTAVAQGRTRHAAHRLAATGRRAAHARPTFAACWEDSDGVADVCRSEEDEEGDDTYGDVGLAGLTLGGWGQGGGSSGRVHGRSTGSEVPSRDAHVQKLLQQRQAQRRVKPRSFDQGPRCGGASEYEENDVVSAILAAEEGLGLEKAGGTRLAGTRNAVQINRAGASGRTVAGVTSGRR